MSGILSVVILDSEEALASTDGHAAINADTKGEEMSRMSKTFSKIFAVANLLGLDGTHQRGSDLAGQVVGCISVRINVLHVAVSHFSWPIGRLQI